MAGGEQRTEDPTPKRLRDARRRGQIPRSADLVGWVSVLVASYILPSLTGSVGEVLTRYVSDSVQALSSDTPEVGFEVAAGLFDDLAVATAPFFVVMMVIAAGGMAVQGGVTLSTEPLRPKLERISLAKGIKRLVSPQSAVDTAKAIVRLVVLAALVSGIATELIVSYLGSGDRDLVASGRDLAAGLLLLVRLAALAGIVVGLADYAWQRRRVSKQLKMTKQEVKQEHRSTDGDPMIRSRRRSLHARLSRNQMLAAVGEASVVVVNPTHVAVALTYSAGTIPTVVAKGGDELARRIRERAFESDVPVVEARPLARILHDTIDVGAEVPAPLYEAVAVVIAFVMRQPRSSVDRVVRTVNVPRSALGDDPDGSRSGARRR
ncbi:MAG: flagellar biosynthesis protein FlhB [Acidimicrobiales bacterium]